MGMDQERINAVIKSTDREKLGRAVHAASVEFWQRRSDQGCNVDPLSVRAWEALNGPEQELARDIGDAVATIMRERCVAVLQGRANRAEASGKEQQRRGDEMAAAEAFAMVDVLNAMTARINAL